jgi:hypothetical protein
LLLTSMTFDGWPPPGPHAVSAAASTVTAAPAAAGASKLLVRTGRPAFVGGIGQWPA